MLQDDYFSYKYYENTFLIMQVSARQQLESEVRGLEDLVKQCEDQTDSVIGLQVPVIEKIDKLKV